MLSIGSSCGRYAAAHYRAVQSVCLAKTNRETSENVVAAAHTLYPDNATARDALLEAAATAASSSSAAIDDPAMRELRAKLFGMILYPGQSAVGHWVEFFVNSLSRSLAVNLPIYLVPALLVHRGRLLGPRGPELALRVAVGVVASLHSRGGCQDLGYTDRVLAVASSIFFYLISSLLALFFFFSGTVF